MDRDTNHALSPAEAKARLRVAAQQLTAANVLGRHRWSILAAALAGGFVVGRLGIPVTARAMLIRQVAPLLLTVLLRKHNGK